MRNSYGLTIRERIEIWFKGRYYDLWACPRGKHYMKMSGCIYCGGRP